MQPNLIEKANSIPDPEEQRTIKGLFYLLDQNAYGLDFKITSGHVSEVQIVAANLTKIPRNLKQLQYLTSLFLGNNMISHLRGLDTLSQLLKLDLSNNRLDDISDLAVQKKLRWLNLSGNQILDISVLKNIIKLEHLDLSHNKIENVDPIASTIELEYLNLKDNPISIGSLQKVLSALTKLSVLDLSNTGIIRMPDFECNRSIQYLYLSDNHIEDISFLNDFPNLLYADLTNNPVLKLVRLDKCPNLKELNLKGTLLSEKEISVAKLGFSGFNTYFLNK